MKTRTLIWVMFTLLFTLLISDKVMAQTQKKDKGSHIPPPPPPPSRRQDAPPPPPPPRERPSNRPDTPPPPPKPSK